MIETQYLLNFLKKEKIDFFSGVPDSILKSTSSFLEKNKLNHHVTANEGSAVSMAIGYHLATKKLACVYMQNSGLGNALNPLISFLKQKGPSLPEVKTQQGSINNLKRPQNLLSIKKEFIKKF